jgi:hypothetical protein
VKDLSFHNSSSFALRYFFLNVNGKAIVSVTHPPLVILYWLLKLRSWPYRFLFFFCLLAFARRGQWCALCDCVCVCVCVCERERERENTGGVLQLVFI